MIEKKTIVDEIKIVRSGHVEIRLGLLLLEDGVEIGCKWHRLVVEPGGDVEAAIAAVNADITTREALKAAPLAAENVLPLIDICDVVHTNEVVAKYRAAVQAAEAAMKAAPSPEEK